MKLHAIVVALAAVISPTAAGESLNIECGAVTYKFPASDAGDMVYSGSQTLTVLGREFNLSDISRMYVDGSEPAAASVSVVYNGESATVAVDGRIARYVAVNVAGADVSVAQTSDLATELTYVLAGESGNGSFSLAGSFKSTIELRGLTLTSAGGAALAIANGKRIKLKVADATVNSLTDAPGGSQKGCVDCKGHLEISGHGTLSVSGLTNHAIFAKEYLTIKNAQVNVLSAVKDGVNCNQYFAMQSGGLTINGVGDDGLQVSFKDEANRETEDTGSITIDGGTIEITADATSAKAVKADGDITVSGGMLTATVSGGGRWSADDNKTKASAAVSADGNVFVGGNAQLALKASGSGGKGISVDGAFRMDGGSLSVETSGGLYAYVNGTEYNNYTGNTDRLDSRYRCSPKGVRAEGDVTVNGGSIRVVTSGNGAEGIESKARMEINDGEIYVNAYDDALNSASHMYINGGRITAIASNNDGLDSNGNMYIAGGHIMAFGARSPECGIDANEEEGYSVHFTGGVLLAVGGNNSVPSSSASTQPYVSGNVSVTAGAAVELTANNTTLASFTIPEEYVAGTSGPRFAPGGWGPGGGGGWGPGGGNSGGGFLISCPGLVSGQSYAVSVGSSTTTLTAR